MKRGKVMQLGIIGLGRMGANMAQRLLNGGHQVAGYDRSRDTGKDLESAGGVRASSIRELVERLVHPRAVWVMVPAGDPVTETLRELASLLSPGDTVIDGGNSFYKDSIERSNRMKEKKIDWLDIGTSGGIWGLKEGYCLMIGGKKEAFSRLEPIFKSLAPEGGYLFCGSAGAGHFAKMVHNGIEYGMLQAYAEGFEVLEASSYGFNMQGVAELWNRGSVVRSWLLELAAEAFKKEPELASIRGYVEDSGEGRWIVNEAIEKAIPLPVITDALMARFRSRQEESFSARVIAALRKEFGGHQVKKSEEKS
jgi:6-phosphogluconate dehydrogenase